MKFTPEVGRRIIAALAAKLPNKQLGGCPICQSTAWELLDAFVGFTITDEPQQVSLGGKILPNAVLVCTNCGNTHFLNLNRLGLVDLLTPEPEAKFQVSEVPQEPPGGLAPPQRVPLGEQSTIHPPIPAPRRIKK